MIPTTSRSDDQALCVRARTVLAICHEVWCEHVDAAPGAPASAGLLEVQGQPCLVPAVHPDGFRPGDVVSCLAFVDDVGMVRLTAVLQAPRRAADDPAVQRALREHEDCLVTAVPVEAITVLPMLVIAVALVPPEQSVELALDPAAVREAAPDWVLGHGPQLVAHLEQSHADELVRLAWSHGVRLTSSVSVVELDRHRARLACLTTDGVTSLEIIFDPPVREPNELWARLSPPVRGRPETGAS